MVTNWLTRPYRNAGQRLENVGRTAQRAPLRDVLRHARQSHGGDPAPVGGTGEAPARRVQVGQRTPGNGALRRRQCSRERVRGALREGETKERDRPAEPLTYLLATSAPGRPTSPRFIGVSVPRKEPVMQKKGAQLKSPALTDRGLATK